MESAAWPFFARIGWHEEPRSFDLLIRLQSYRTPEWVFHRRSEAGATFQEATPEMRTQVLQFERHHFPIWATFYEGVKNYEESNVVVARDASGDIVGTVLLSSVVSVPWKYALISACGSLGVLGVSKLFEGRGIGLAMAAWGTELLRAPGCCSCHIGWTGLWTGTESSAQSPGLSTAWGLSRCSRFVWFRRRGRQLAEDAADGQHD